MDKHSRILVTGAAGMGGSAVVRELQSQGYKDIIAIDKTECDLRDTSQVRAIFKMIHPQYIFHLAAKVGGIHANNTQSGAFTYENLMMQCNVFETARLIGVKKLIFCGSACIYPKFSPQPILEESLLSSELEETNIGYAIAKIAGVIMCRMYRKQYGSNFICAMPTNLYGIGDNFTLLDSHVMPALIRKFHEGKVNGMPSVEVWGTGRPRREFLYVDDLASALVFLVNNYEDAYQINVGTGVDVPIYELAAIIKEIVGFKGEVKFNPLYPDGVFERRLDVRRINDLGWKAKTELYDGIEKTYKWFVNAKNVRIEGYD